ncbi:hypothetical protein [Salana multivorans]
MSGLGSASWGSEVTPSYRNDAGPFGLSFACAPLTPGQDAARVAATVHAATLGAATAAGAAGAEGGSR